MLAALHNLSVQRHYMLMSEQDLANQWSDFHKDKSLFTVGLNKHINNISSISAEYFISAKVCVVRV
jgi:hypothetical protein